MFSTIAAVVLATSLAQTPDPVAPPPAPAALTTQDVAAVPQLERQPTLLTTDILSLVGRQLDVSLTRRVNNLKWLSWSIGLELGGGGTRREINDVAGYFNPSSDRYGGGLRGGVSFFVLGSAPEGLWVGPRVWAFGSMSATTSRYPQNLVGPPVETTTRTYEARAGVALEVGYTAIIAKHLVLGASFAAEYGAGYQWDSRDDNTPVRSAVSGWGLSPRLSVGWAF